MKPIIKVENLSKCYRLQGGARNNTLRDSLIGAIKSLFPGRLNAKEKTVLWALRDVSFTVNEGDTLGIVGKNGSGKSTLLKILSRITKPTKGAAELRGRVGSLLEVGTGFHQELSGRENIFLNGAILGMKRREIEKRFDEIVAFAEIEKFIETPVKFYSSGMFMRLAFSVAAHLDPKILIVDEVLAVGDVSFQKKCLSKMRDVSQSGRTILFVSHDMQAITRLCSRAIWLKDGELIKSGETNQVVSSYLFEQTQTASEKSWKTLAESPGNEITKLRRVRVCDEFGESVTAIDIRRPVGIEMTYDALEAGKVFVPNLHFYNEHGVCIFVSHDWGTEWRSRLRPPGTYVSTVWIPGNFLAEGAVFVTAAATTYEPFKIHFVERDTISFNVIDSLDGDSARGDFAGVMPGIVRPILNWKTEFTSK